MCLVDAGRSGNARTHIDERGDLRRDRLCGMEAEQALHRARSPVPARTVSPSHVYGSSRIICPISQSATIGRLPARVTERFTGKREAGHAYLCEPGLRGGRCRIDHRPDALRS
ncbi:hypothetical protein HCN51_51405 [Nonomuraea sp. FMUSA5-5]|uniref:Uncharacterized protein n=1 Tax=Nonomuraea composti TaxID=2720023 RepID=A0ABX1BME0_9ACTN|nr:hypothetical protein [Nonomuraea sp. FMUSA5-5]NJP97739.1 hypothetical protein [Nonomuraea sp. FMUSA5-5]